MKKVGVIGLIVVVCAAVLLVTVALIGCSDDGKGFGANKVKFLHFVDEDGNTLLDYRLDQYYKSDKLQKAIDGINVDYYEMGQGTYLDGTAFSTDFDTLNDYILNHEADCTVEERLFLSKNTCPAYTVVLDLIPLDYTISYNDVDGATFDKVDTYNAESDVVLPTPTKLYYDFVCWYEKASAEEWYRVDTLPTTAPRNLELYALWEPRAIEVTYEGVPEGIVNPNEGGKIFQKDGAYTLKGIPASDAYLFKGWKLGDAYVTELDPMVLWEKDANQFVLTADIEILQFEVNYYADGVLVDSKTFDFYTLEKLQSPAVPDKEHYTGHWAEKVTEFRDYNIEAIYEIDKYAVGVQTNIVDYTVETKQYDYGTTYAAVYEQLSYAGKRLMGLYYEPNFATKVKADDLIVADATVYAKWSSEFKIAAPADWALMAEQKDGYFVLENDINFAGEAIPVLDSFDGILDGQGHTVSNFINQNNACVETYGLFGVNNGTITNINFANGVYVASTVNTANGMFVGFVSGINYGTIDNVRVADMTVKITCNHSTAPLGIWLGNVEGQAFAGVLAGLNRGTIAHCTVADTVSANMNTTMYAATGYNSSDNFIRTWATYGLIAGGNYGLIDHVTAAASLSSTATRTETLPDGYSNYFRYVYFPLRVGGIVGSNQAEGTISNAVVSAKLTVDHEVSARRVYLGLLDIGGVSGVSGGKIDRCFVDENTVITAYANGEERVGGISGTNDGDGIIKSSYTKAAFVVGNRSTTEKTYWGGIVGLNDAAVTYCYAVIGSDDMRGTAFANSADNGSVGGMFGKGTASSSVLNSFVMIDCIAPQGVTAVSALGAHEGATLMNGYICLTANAVDFAISSDVTNCATVDDLLTAVGKLGYENMGYTVTEGSYPLLENVGDCNAEALQ